MAGKTTLYDLSEELRSVLALLDTETSGDDGAATGEIPADLDAQLDRVTLDFATKIDGVLRARVNYVALKEGVDVELKRLVAMKKSYESRDEWLKNYVLTAMLAAGQKELTTKLFKLTVKKNSQPSVKLDDGLPVPAKFNKAASVEVTEEMRTTGLAASYGCLANLSDDEANVIIADIFRAMFAVFAPELDKKKVLESWKSWRAAVAKAEEVLATGGDGAEEIAAAKCAALPSGVRVIEGVHLLVK